MPNLAILVGNSEYRTQQRLECCKADVGAMRALLEATQKYETIELIENADANDLKTRIRGVVERTQSIGELFFYFTGHGFSYEDEFFCCATDFDPNRPHETGLSTVDLHAFLRQPNPDLVVKVVDACNSGTHLVKSDVGLSQQNKYGFKNLIQMSSCLDTQSALTGDPLSLFTQKFNNAALSKAEGAVYYMDLIAALRDQFMGNDSQIPFFVSQYTGREVFVDDAHKFDQLREAQKPREAVLVGEISAPVETVHAPPPTLAQILVAAQAKIATPEVMNHFVATLFDYAKAQLAVADFAEFFELETAENDTFQEITAKRFVIEILSREKRADNFVTAEISRKRNKVDRWLGSSMAALTALYDDEQYVEMYDLSLNCKMPRVQLRVTLTPKFSLLQQIVLVITCAPSLETCYVFEIITQHMLKDFGKFDPEGTNAVRRWYRFDWRQSTESVVRKISQSLSEIVRTHLENTTKRLGEKS